MVAAPLHLQPALAPQGKALQFWTEMENPPPRLVVQMGHHPEALQELTENRLPLASQVPVSPALSSGR